MQAAVAFGLATFVEVHDSAELDAALRADAPVIGVNNRDLRTLRTSLDPSLALLPLIPPGHVAVSESGIASGADVERVVAAGAPPPPRGGGGRGAAPPPPPRSARPPARSPTQAPRGPLRVTRGRASPAARARPR